MIYLKFDSEDQMKEVLEPYMTRDTEVVVDEDTGESTEVEVGDKYFIGKPKSLTYGHKAGQWEIWVRGILTVPTGEVDSEDNPIRVPISGFHVDFDPKLGGYPAEDWEDYIQVPANPQFVKA